MTANINIHGQLSEVVIDTGSGINLINYDYYREFLANKNIKIDENDKIPIKAANDQTIQTIGTAMININTNRQTALHRFEVVKGLSVNVILGIHYLK